MMIKEPLVFKLEESLCSTLHYLFYMTESYSEILKDIIENKRCITANKELLNYYNEQYLEYYMKYRTLLDEAVHSVFDLPENTKAIFHFDFMKQELVITELIQL